MEVEEEADVDQTLHIHGVGATAPTGGYGATARGRRRHGGGAGPPAPPVPPRHTNATTRDQARRIHNKSCEEPLKGYEEDYALYAPKKKHRKHLTSM